MSALHGLLAVFSGLLGAFVALNHPLWPAVLTVLFCAWCVAVYARPAIWLFAVPALLPVAGFSAWTGWLGVEEFDLLVLGAAAGCHARMATLRARPEGNLPQHSGDFACVAAKVGPKSDGWFRAAQVWLALLALSYSLALVRGLLDAGDFRLEWFQGYEEPLNSLRVGKSFALVLLLLPSLRSLLRSTAAQAERRFVTGLAIGLGLVGLAIACERAGYPGLFDFSTPYRTTAWFWEMHVGGAALDGFLVLAVPFAVYVVLNARTPWHWALAALLTVAAGYACLTTFSRGVYLGVAAALILLAWQLRRPARLGADPAQTAMAAHLATRPAPEPWRVWGDRLLVGVLILEAVAVLGLGDFMSTRLSTSERDLGGRLEHWREGLSLLRAPADLLLGRGLGRFPANYSQAVPGRGMPGRLHIVDDGGGRYLRIFGPQQCARACRGFELLQRLPALADGAYTVTMDLRAPQGARLSVGSCQQHLLYAASCARQTLVIATGDDGWRQVSVLLTARAAVPGGRRIPGPGFLVLRPEELDDFIDVQNVSVRDDKAQELLHNGTFSDGMAHWFFRGRHCFLPWHIDSLFLEVLIEQGVFGLLALLMLLSVAFGNLLRGPGRQHPLAPYLLAALAACLVVGVFSSVLDMPRPAFLFFLLLCCALFLDSRGAADPPRELSKRMETP